MCDKNMTAKNGEKLYLATFEFVSGEYEQSFQRLIYAKDDRDVDRKIENILRDYYGKASQIDGDIYFYWNSEIAVKYCGRQEITDFQQIVNRLLWW